MEKQYTVESLREEIKALEIKQKKDEEEFRMEVREVYNNFRPANILKSLAKDFYSSDNLMDELVSTAVSLTSGFISKKLVIGKSKNQVLRLIGMAVQIGITSFVSKKIDFLKDALLQMINRFTENREEKSEIEEKEEQEPHTENSTTTTE